MTEEVVVNEEEVNEKTKEEAKVDWEAKAKELEKKAQELEAEAAKHRAKRKTAEQERDALKKTPKKDNPEVTEYVKQQLEEVTSKLGKYAEKAKMGAIKVAASSKLGAMGINPDALELAIQQLDKSMINYDEDSEEVDDTALSAAVSKLKSKHPFLFEKNVVTPKVRHAAEGSADGNDGVISQEEWRSMNTREQRVAIKAGKRVAQ